MDIKEFHNKLVKLGPMPLCMLKKSIRLMC